MKKQKEKVFEAKFKYGEHYTDSEFYLLDGLCTSVFKKAKAEAIAEELNLKNNEIVKIIVRKKKIVLEEKNTKPKRKKRIVRKKLLKELFG